MAIANMPRLYLLLLITLKYSMVYQCTISVIAMVAVYGSDE